MLLELIPYSADKVQWSNSLKRGVIEASTLGLRPGHQFTPLYDDACDVGLALSSNKTGATVYWYWAEDVFTNGEFSHYVLEPTYESVRKYPQLKDYKLHILND